jgi:hypothetical protein
MNDDTTKQQPAPAPMPEQGGEMKPEGGEQQPQA